MNSASPISKEYPRSDVFERAYLVKIFHNPSLQDRYLDQTLPATFLDVKRRLVIWLMKKLREENLPIKIDNMLMIQAKGSEAFLAFKRKHRVESLTEGELTDILLDPSVDGSDRFFDNCKDEILKSSFSRFVEDILTDIRYYNSFNNSNYHPYITSRFKAGMKIYDLIYSRIGNIRDQYSETKALINNPNEYVGTSSRVLNSFLGGFTRGYVGTIIAKSSHGKSSWADYNIMQNLASGKIRTVAKITPEESASTQYRRYLAMLCKLSTSGMRLKQIEVTEAHLDVLRDKLHGRLHIYDDVFKMKDIIDLMHTLKDDMIYLDHINSIDYPGKGSYMERMVGNIPAMIDAEKRLAKEKNIPIINLSQVGDKDIQKSDRLIKAPRYFDAYGSSVLYQAAREFLALWYPYKDEDDSGISISTTPASPNDIHISIEKSSFSKVGKIRLHFDPEYNTFTDTEQYIKKMEKHSSFIPAEERLF